MIYKDIAKKMYIMLAFFLVLCYYIIMLYSSLRRWTLNNCIVKKFMSNIIQNVKLGFANMRELINIFISDDTNNDSEGYDLYINGKDEDMAKMARELKEIEEKQESVRITSLIAYKPKTKSNINSKKKYESTPKNVTKKESSRKNNSDVQILDKEPEK